MSRTVSEIKPWCKSLFFAVLFFGCFMPVACADSSAATPNLEPSPLALIESEHFKRASVVVGERYCADRVDPETLYRMLRVKQAYCDMAAAFDFAKKAEGSVPDNLTSYYAAVA